MYQKTVPQHLKHLLAVPLPQRFLRPTVAPNGARVPPKYSLEFQQQLRDAAVACGVDPVGFLGLPPERPVDKSMLDIPPPEVVAEWNKEADKQALIKKRMAEMPAMIAKWRQEQEEKKTRKSHLPF